jgi:hypothetical protein
VTAEEHQMTPEESLVVLAAASVIVRTRLSMLEDEALETLRERPGLALAPLWPGSPVIQLVTFDGVHIGRVRLENPHERRESWVAVPLPPKRSHGSYSSAWTAAESLLAHRYSWHGRISS